MTDAFSSDVSDRICKHMNDDHADAIKLYARVFGGEVSASAAKMVAIDAEGMDLSVQVNDETKPVRITFDHELHDSEDAHQTLIAMVKEARQRITASSS
jgi:putative heme iron utilization protein